MSPKKKLSITYVVGSLTIRGGMERILTEKMNALADTGRYAVCVVCVWQAEDTRNAFALSPKVRQICLPPMDRQGNGRSFRQNPLGYIGRWLRNEWRQKRQVDGILRELQTDILIAASNYVPLSFYTFRGRTIIESHCNITELTRVRTWPALSMWMTRFAARRATAVVTLTNGDAALWPSARRVEVIPNFTCLPATAPCGYRSRRVVAVGRICEQKGFDLLVEAWKTVTGRHPDWHLDIYGEGDQRHALQQQIADGGLSKVVSLHPFTTDVASVYARAAFYVMSSRYEGFGLVLIEAMRCGLPCVSFDCASGPSEIITDGRDGILVPYRGLSREERIDGLAQALCRMIDHEEQIPTMGHAAQETSQRYTTGNVIPMWERLFEGL